MMNELRRLKDAVHPDEILLVADGMTGQEIEEVLRDNPGDEGLREGGIGLRNVIRRVTLATGGRGRVEIESSPTRGMSIRIHLPVEGGA